MSQTPRTGPKYPTTTRDLNFYTEDDRMQRFLIEEGQFDALDPILEDYGHFAATTLDREAARNDSRPPRLVPVLEDEGVPGPRCNVVEFDGSYEPMQQEIFRRGIIGLAYNTERPMRHLVSFLLGCLTSHSWIGAHCTKGALTGADALVVDKYAPEEVKSEFLPRLTSMDGDTMSGATISTEPQGGTDLGGTLATAKTDDSGAVRLYGTKWFGSNAGGGLILVLARPDGAPDGIEGVAAYLVPGMIDGKPNTHLITALKDKMGTRDLATAEYDLNGCAAIQIAPPGQGVRVYMEALEYSRVHNAVAGLGVVHRAYLEAMAWTENRDLFKQKAIEKPTIQDDLITLKTEYFACSALAYHAAKSYSAIVDDPRPSGADASWVRLVTAAAKYRTAEQAVQCMKMAQELGGGNHYTKDFQTERMFRDAVALILWEGPKHVQALEMMRVILKKDKDQDTLSDRLEQICEGLPESVAPLRWKLSSDLRELRSEIRTLKDRRDRADNVAVQFLTKISNIMTFALMSKDAGRDMDVYGDDTALLLAEHFHATTLQDRIAIKFDSTELQDRFNEIVSRKEKSVPAPAGAGAPASGKKSDDRQSPWPWPTAAGMALGKS